MKRRRAGQKQYRAEQNSNNDKHAHHNSVNSDVLNSSPSWNLSPVVAKNVKWVQSELILA